MEAKCFWSNNHMEKKEAQKARGLPAIWRHGGDVHRRVRNGPSHEDEFVYTITPGDMVVGIVLETEAGLWLKLLTEDGYVHMKSVRFERSTGNAGVMAHSMTSQHFRERAPRDCVMPQPTNGSDAGRVPAPCRITDPQYHPDRMK